MFGKRKAPSGPENLPGERAAGQGLVEIGGVRDPKSAEPATAGPARAEVAQYLLAAYKDARGIHVETVLSAAGALAGFAAQMAIRKGMAPKMGLPAEKILVTVGGKDGHRYFFGDTLNMIVATQEQGKLSIWRFVAAPMVKAGLPLPDLTPIFANVAATVGGEMFGIPSMAREKRLHELPFAALKRHWEPVQRILENHRIEPLHWPLEIALAAQDLIEMAKATLQPDVGALVAMESAIMMSKVDPDEVPGAASQVVAGIPRFEFNRPAR